MKVGASLAAFFRNAAFHIGFIWILLFWAAVWAFGGGVIKTSTDWACLAAATMLSLKWAPNSFEGFMAQLSEGRHRLAMGLNLVFIGIGLQCLYVLWLGDQGLTSIRLDNTISGFIRAIILGGMLLCLSAEADVKEFVTRRRWYYQVGLVACGIFIGVAINRLFGFS